MSGDEPYFIQFEPDELAALTYEDREFIHTLKVSLRCNEARHHECSIEIKEKGWINGKPALVSKFYHWLHGDGQVGVKKWEWCMCRCHTPLSKKKQWMNENLPSHKKKA